MAGIIVLIVYLAGILPCYVICARLTYKEFHSSYRTGRDGEAMAMAAVTSMLLCGVWPVCALIWIIHFLYRVGIFDRLFMDQETRVEILRNERDERIRELEYQASMSPDQIYRRQEVIDRLPAKYRRVQ